jgi:hypothetical protein
VPFLSGERIAFSYLTSQKFTGDVVALDILREGKPLQLQIKVRLRAGGAAGREGWWEAWAGWSSGWAGGLGWMAGWLCVSPTCPLSGRLAHLPLAAVAPARHAARS